MGKLIKFPAHRVVHNNPKSPDLTEEEARQIKEDKFVEQITESLILDIIHVLQDNVVDTKTDVFLRDLGSKEYVLCLMNLVISIKFPIFS